MTQTVYVLVFFFISVLIYKNLKNNLVANPLRYVSHMSKKVWPEMSKDSHREPNTDLQDLKLLISRIWVSFESKHEPVKSPILNVSLAKFTPNPTHKTSFWVWAKTILSSKIPNECSKTKNSYHRPENVFLDFPIKFRSECEIQSYTHCPRPPPISQT